MTLRFRLIAFCLLILLGFPNGLRAQVRRDLAGDALPAGALIRMGSLRFSSPDGVMEFALSADDQTLVSFGNVVIGWDANSGRELWRQHSPIGYLPACYGNRAITPWVDGEHFLVADHQAGWITKWNLRTGEQELTEFTMSVGDGGFGNAARALDVAPDTRLLFIGSGQGYRVVTLENEVLYERAGPFPALERGRDRLTFGGGYAYGRFSPDGKRLALVTSDTPKVISLLDAKTGKPLGEIHCAENVVRLEFSPAGTQIAASQRDTALRLYDCESLEQVWENVFDVDKRSENYTSALAFSPNGEELLVCERNQTIFKVDAQNGELLDTLRDHSWNPWALIFRERGEQFFSSGWGGTIHQWDAASLSAIPLNSSYRGTDAITLTPNGQFCAGLDQDGTIHIVQVSTGEPVRELSMPMGTFEVLEYSRDSNFLAAGGSWDGEVHVVEWELATGMVSHHWSWEIGADPVTGVEDIVYSPDDEHLLISVFRQDASYLLDRESEKSIKMPHSRVYGSSFSASGDKLFTAGWDKMMRVWDGRSGELLDELAPESKVADKRMYSVCADPTGQTLATCTLNESIGIYDTDSMELIREWDVGSSFVFGALRFSPDGLWLASGNASGQVILWDPFTGDKLREIKAHDNHIYTIDFGSNNQILCSGGSNVGYVWSLRPDLAQWRNVGEAMEKIETSSADDAYRAWWYLVDHSDESLNLVTTRLLAATDVYDIDKLVEKSSEAQRDRRREMLLTSIANKPEAITLTAARRLLSVLSHIDSPLAQPVLEQLAQREGPIADLANFHLSRAR